MSVTSLASLGETLASEGMGRVMSCYCFINSKAMKRETAGLLPNRADDIGRGGAGRSELHPQKSSFPQSPREGSPRPVCIKAECEEKKQKQQRARSNSGVVYLTEALRVWGTRGAAAKGAKRAGQSHSGAAPYHL